MDRKGHLPRLAREHYRGRAFVHWTLTVEGRATGWLTPSFHADWQLMLMHASARYRLLAPAFVLMPDHVHLIWIGLDEHGSDQILAVEFLRKNLRTSLSPAEWQRQAHDNVLRESEREHGGFQIVAHYALENPVRAGLAAMWKDYRCLGCCVPGYPEFDVRTHDYWERFWRCHNFLVDRKA